MVRLKSILYFLQLASEFIPKVIRFNPRTDNDLSTSGQFDVSRKYSYLTQYLITFAVISYFLNKWMNRFASKSQGTHLDCKVPLIVPPTMGGL